MNVIIHTMASMVGAPKLQLVLQFMRLIIQAKKRLAGFTLMAIRMAAQSNSMRRQVILL